MVTVSGRNLAPSPFFRDSPACDRSLRCFWGRNLVEVGDTGRIPEQACVTDTLPSSGLSQEEQLLVAATLGAGRGRADFRMVETEGVACL